MTSRQPLVLFGISNLLGDIIEVAALAGFRVSTLVTNQPEVVRPRTIPLSDRLGRLEQPPAVVPLEDFFPSHGEAYFIGTTSTGKGDLVDKLWNRFAIRFCNLIHPRAFVSASSTLGEGVFLGANSVIGSGCGIGDHVFINRGVTVGHDTRIGRFSRLSPGCNVAGFVRIGEACVLGMGCNVIEELVIGDRAVVAAGAVVIRDVQPDTLVAGVPAELKKGLAAKV